MMNLIPEEEIVQYTPDMLESLPYPAYLLNERLIFTYRNKAAYSRLVPFVVRSKLDKQLTAKDRARVSKMQKGDEIFINMSSIGTYGAILHRQRDGYCLAIRNITAQMIRYISEKAIAIPSFFGDTEGEICNLRLATFRSPEEMRRVRQNYHRALRYQSEIATYFRVTGGNIPYDIDGEMSGPINSLLKSAHQMLLCNGIQLVLRLNERIYFARGDVNDLCYATASLVAIAAENLNRYARIFAETNILEKAYYVSITFEPNFDDTVFKGMLSEYYCGNLLNGPYRNMFFDMLLVQMLSESNGWQFHVTNPSCSGGMLCMTIRVPKSVERPTLLNCPPDHLPLLEMMLVEILGNDPGIE